jgi:hypothetical protein
MFRYVVFDRITWTLSLTTADQILQNDHSEDMSHPTDILRNTMLGCSIQQQQQQQQPQPIYHISSNIEFFIGNSPHKTPTTNGSTGNNTKNATVFTKVSSM